jgi:hypothetical protein
MTDWPPRAMIENFEMEDADRFKLSLRFPKVYISPDGRASVWLTRKEVETLQDNCAASLLDDDVTGSSSMIE